MAAKFKVIERGGGYAVAPVLAHETGLTNAEAWRMADRMNGEANTRAEDLTEFIARK